MGAGQHHLGECGMCNFQGRGVSIDKTISVAEYCCHCNARTYQSHDGVCELCGKDAEGDDAVAVEEQPPSAPDWTARQVDPSFRDQPLPSSEGHH